MALAELNFALNDNMILMNWIWNIMIYSFSAVMKCNRNKILIWCNRNQMKMKLLFVSKDEKGFLE